MPLLFIAPLLMLPLLEIIVLVLLGSTIGFWPTVGLVIGCGVLGVLLLRLQGLDMLRRLQESLRRRELPSAELFDGLCLALAGVLLVLPGLVTDAAALVLLVPAVRRWLFGRLRRRIGRAGGAAAGMVIEGTWTEVRGTRGRLPNR